MTCNCITTISKNVEDMLKEKPRFKKPIIRVSLKETTFVRQGNTMTMGTITNAKVELEGQKKVELIPIYHTYCPFCGVKKSEDGK